MVKQNQNFYIFQKKKGGKSDTYEVNLSEFYIQIQYVQLAGTG
jgi:hypothetical protein